jgi:hypothetical protein
MGKAIFALSFLTLAFLTLAIGPAHAENIQSLGSNTRGAQIFVDRDSLKVTPPIRGLRNFEAVQILASYDLSGVRSDPARTEKALYSFNCKARTINLLSYQRYRANGTKLHDWKAADLDFKYEPVAPGSLTEAAMLYACSGGKLPSTPVPNQSEGLAKVEDEE